MITMLSVFLFQEFTLYSYRSPGPREVLQDWRAGPLPGGGEVPGGLRRRPGGHLHPGALHWPAAVRRLAPVHSDQLPANIQCLQSPTRHQVINIFIMINLHWNINKKLFVFYLLFIFYPSSYNTQLTWWIMLEIFHYQTNHCKKDLFFYWMLIIYSV